MRVRGFIFIFGVLNLVGQAVFADGAEESAGRCDSLKNTDFSTVVDAPTQITSSTFVEASGERPALCEVRGYVSPNGGFGMRLPVKWNGKFMQIGCGGFCGYHLDGPQYSAGCDDPLRRGYACLLSDMGHQGAVLDGLWAQNNLQAKVDWGFRATHVATLAGKAITERFYSKPAARSYFMGCSTGGRQALQSAQRFPWDFDGIIAGSAPVDLSAFYMYAAWAYQSLHDKAGKPLLAAEDLKLLSDAALEKCDADDGVRDGIIGMPLQCGFDPQKVMCSGGRTARCLTPLQIAAAKRIYEGPRDSQGHKLSLGGPLPGTEQSWELFLSPEGRLTPFQNFMADGFRYLFFWPEPGPAWSLKDFDFDRDYRRMGLMQALTDSGNPDLRRFKAAEGKLLVFQGMNDTAFVRPAADYYETVERTMGGREATQAFFRLFMLPGVGHCAGGVGADAADFLGHLEAWVERGEAPERILSGHVKDAPSGAYPYQQFPSDPKALSFTRPLFPYPLKTKYRGHGDPNDAASFTKAQ